MVNVRLVPVVLGAVLTVGLASPIAAASDDPRLSSESSETGADASAEGRGHRHTHGPDGLDLDRGRRPGAAVAAETVDGTLTGDWSTADPLSVSAVDEPDRFQGLPSVHLVYLYGSEVKKPRTDFLNMFEADARAAQRLLQERYGRSVRFDERVDGRLDITVVKSRYRTSSLGGSKQFDLVSNELERVFPDSESPRKKYIAWLDAPSKYCGQGELYGDWHRDRENWNDLRTTGVVYRPYDPGNVDGGFCRGRTLLHELGHNLGALYSKAPSAFDGAHCNDDKNDVMCYAGSVTSGTDTSGTSSGQFDYGNNDYWDAGAVAGSDNGGPESGEVTDEHLKHLNWWTVNLSRFVCRPNGDGVSTASCGDSSTVHPTLDEFRYHSGDEAYPPPPSQPTT